MTGHITLKELAKRLGIHPASLWRRMQRDGIQAVYGPVMTDSGPQRARWVPRAYAEQLVSHYQIARANSKE
jgi:hypothetical protein